MKVTKILTNECVPKCCECYKYAEVVLELGDQHEIPLCLECAWDLKDLMDETTFTTFEQAEK